MRFRSLLPRSNRSRSWVFKQQSDLRTEEDVDARNIMIHLAQFARVDVYHVVSRDELKKYGR